MTNEKSDWVCRACIKQDHKNCEGTAEDPEKIVNFCECEVCVRRFRLKLKRILHHSSERSKP